MRTLFPALAAMLIAGAASVSAIPASAQTALTTAPASLDLGPTTAKSTSVLQPFAVSPDKLVFSGETQKRTVVFVAQAEQIGGLANLILNLQTAISDAPESSHLQIAINGHDLGTLQLRAGDPYSVQMQVPSGIIQPGYNALTLVADQSHRVDCSLQATYELWTRIDPHLSGIQYASTNPAQNSFSSVLGVARSDAGRTPIHAIVTAGGGQDRAQLLKAIQALSISAGFDQPKVEFGSDIGTGMGVNVIVGSLHTVTELLGNRIDANLHDGINIAQDATGRIVLALIGEGTADLDRQIADLSRYAGQFDTGAPQGVAAVAQMHGLPLDANGRVTFSTLGIDDRTFSGRLYRQSVEFRMPADFYPADYARASIHLDALYARGLATGAQLLVKLNDKTVSTLALSGSRGGEIKNQILPISMMAFRPGMNELSIEAALPTAADAVCDPAHIADGGRLRLSGSSYLELPDIARVGRLPDLGALDMSIGGKTGVAALDIVLDDRDPSSLDAAGTFLAKLAYSSGRVFDAKVVSSAAYDPAVPSVAIGSFDSLPIGLVDRLHLDLSGVSTSLAVPLPDAPVADNGDTAIDLTWDEQVRDGAGRLGSYAKAQVVQVAQDLGTALGGLGASLGLSTAAVGDAGGTAFAPQSGTALLVAQGADGGGAPLTLIAAPKASDLAAAIDSLADAEVWNRLSGSAATFTSAGSLIQSVPVRSSRLFLTEPASLNNGRLIAAGWLSNNPAVYVIVLFLFAGFLGLTTFLVLWRGRKQS